MDRFFNSLAQVRITPVYSRGEMVDLLQEGLRQSGYANAIVYYHITRGTSARNHPFPDRDVSSNLVITVREFGALRETIRQRGVATNLVEDLRWGRCNIKSLNLLPNILARQEALERGGVEAILYRSGYVTEGAAANMFMVAEGVVKTAPISPQILAGITRMQVLALCRELNIPVREEAFTVAELLAAEEAFLTSSGIGVLPVAQVDEQLVNEGQVGPVTQALQKAFLHLVKECCRVS